MLEGVRRREREREGARRAYERAFLNRLDDHIALAKSLEGEMHRF